MSEEAKRLIMQPSKFHPVDQYNEYLTDLVERAIAYGASVLKEKRRK